MKSLSVKYRPATFEDVCVQDTTIRILKQQLATNTISHAYLFYGPSGCGKTTVARILANRINQGSGSPIEIDGASNNGVENVRYITHSATERALDARYKIYIIDECHALSTQAWQAFLKCIEEPPAYTVFIFCTTDIQKVPTTIRNRCMKFNFTKIPPESIRDRLCYICNNERCDNYVELCDIISRTGNGQLRDAISLLEKCILYSRDLTVTPALLQIVQATSYTTIFQLTNLLLDGKESELLLFLKSLCAEGLDVLTFTNQLLEFYMDVLKYCIFGDISITKFLPAHLEDLTRITQFNQNTDYYNYVITNLLDLKSRLSGDSFSQVTLEIYLLKIARCQ